MSWKADWELPPTGDKEKQCIAGFYCKCNLILVIPLLELDFS